MKNFINSFKCKYEELTWTIRVSIYTNKCNMQCLNNGFNKFKVDDLIHIKMLIVQKMWKKSWIHSNINVGFLLVTCVLINYDKCKMQLLNNGFNMLKIDSSTHVPC